MLAAILFALPAIGATKLHDAVAANDLVQIDALIANGSPVNAVNDGNMTALSLAASKGYAKAAQALVTGGAAIGTDMHWAAINGHVKVIEVLLGAGAEVDGDRQTVPLPEVDRQTVRTPLHSAVIGDQAAAIALLVRSGATLEAQDEEQNTPLFLAAKRGHAVAIKALVKAGAYAWRKGQGGQLTPLHVAANNGHGQAVFELVVALGRRAAELNAKDNNGMTALHMAAAQGHMDAMVQLLAAGAAVDAEADGRRPTPLHWAALRGHVEAIKLLVGENASLEARDDGQMTPLELAIDANQTDAIATLETATKTGGGAASTSISASNKGRTKAPSEAKSKHGGVGTFVFLTGAGVLSLATLTYAIRSKLWDGAKVGKPKRKPKQARAQR